MAKNHLKRLASPKTWNIKKKVIRFVTRPNPGPHKLSFGMPLNTILRDYLHVATSARESTTILNHQEVLVDGIRRKDIRFIVGLMDVLSFKKLGKHYRIVIGSNGRLELIEIPAPESVVKPSKVIGKTSIGKRFQINMSDGKNILSDKSTVKVGDTLLIEIPSQKIKEHIPFEKGSTILLTEGKHSGAIGTIDDIKGNQITIKLDDGERFETRKQYAFAVGKAKPSVHIR